MFPFYPSSYPMDNPYDIQEQRRSIMRLSGFDPMFGPPPPYNMYMRSSNTNPKSNRKVSADPYESRIYKEDKTPYRNVKGKNTERGLSMPRAFQTSSRIPDPEHQFLPVTKMNPPYTDYTDHYTHNTHNHASETKAIESNNNLLFEANQKLSAELADSKSSNDHLMEELKALREQFYLRDRENSNSNHKVSEELNSRMNAQLESLRDRLYEKEQIIFELQKNQSLKLNEANSMNSSQYKEDRTFANLQRVAELEGSIRVLKQENDFLKNSLNAKNEELSKMKSANTALHGDNARKNERLIERLNEQVEKKDKLIDEYVKKINSLYSEIDSLRSHRTSNFNRVDQGRGGESRGESRGRSKNKGVNMSKGFTVTETEFKEKYGRNFF